MQNNPPLCWSISPAGREVEGKSSEQVPQAWMQSCWIHYDFALILTVSPPAPSHSSLKWGVNSLERVVFVHCSTAPIKQNICIFHVELIVQFISTSTVKMSVMKMNSKLLPLVLVQNRGSWEICTIELKIKVGHIFKIFAKTRVICGKNKLFSKCNSL